MQKLTSGRALSLVTCAVVGLGLLGGCGQGSTPSPVTSAAGTSSSVPASAAATPTPEAGSAAPTPSPTSAAPATTAAPAPATGATTATMEPSAIVAAQGLCGVLPDLTKVGELAGLKNLGQPTENKKNWSCTVTSSDAPQNSVTFYMDTSGIGWETLGEAIKGKPREDLLPRSFGGSRTLMVKSGTTVYGVRVLNSADADSDAAEARAAKILQLWGKA